MALSGSPFYVVYPEALRSLICRHAQPLYGPIRSQPSLNSLSPQIRFVLASHV